MKLICDKCESEIEITKDGITGAHPKPEPKPVDRRKHELLVTTTLDHVLQDIKVIIIILLLAWMFFALKGCLS